MFSLLIGSIAGAFGADLECEIAEVRLHAVRTPKNIKSGEAVSPGYAAWYVKSARHAAKLDLFGTLIAC